jgi:hypothetical protein
MMTIDYESQQMAQAQLESGESLLWHSRPDGRRFILGSIAIVLFGIPWTAFSLFWMAAASGFLFSESGNGIFSLFALFGVPLVLVGFGMLSSPYRVYRKMKRTVYALTNRRALIITGGRSQTIRSYSSKDTGIIERTERASGKGDIYFATAEGNKSTQRIGFLGISDARRVERLLVERLLMDVFKKEDAAAFPGKLSGGFD